MAFAADHASVLSRPFAAFPGLHFGFGASATILCEFLWSLSLAE